MAVRGCLAAGIEPCRQVEVPHEEIVRSRELITGTPSSSETMSHAACARAGTRHRMVAGTMIRRKSQECRRLPFTLGEEGYASCHDVWQWRIPVHVHCHVYRGQGGIGVGQRFEEEKEKC